jgi:L-lactate utilization protein LutC
MNRAAFLERVRQATAAGRAYRIYAGDEPREPVGYCGAGPDIVARMAVEVDAVGGHAHVVETWAAARAIVLDLCQQQQARAALCWRDETLERLGLDALLAEARIERLDVETLAALPPEERRTQAEAAMIGITGASFAIAETGTLAMLSAPGRERLASLLPPLHVAIVAAEQVLPDLFDLFDKLREAGHDALPSNLTLITGPSKTGDIELTLTTGVHGPGEWHVVVVRETP